MSDVFYNANNLIINNGFVKNPDRYYLEEWFKQRPALNSILNTAFTNTDATNTANTEIRLAEKVANRDFKVFGTNMTTTLCEFNTNNPGILIKTAGADQDQAIIAPHTSSHSIETSWTNTKWGTENQLEWECAINIPVVTDVKVWAGINLSSEQLLESNNDKLFFKFQTDSTNSETFTDFTKLHFIHSIAGTHYVSELPITVEADTVYKLRITIDSSRLARIFVNGVQYNVTHTEGSSPYGTTVTSGKIPSSQLTNTIDLIPYIGVQTGTTVFKSLIVYYEKMSRTLI
jgi:hypothetical protein